MYIEHSEVTKTIDSEYYSSIYFTRSTSSLNSILVYYVYSVCYTNLESVFNIILSLY